MFYNIKQSINFIHIGLFIILSSCNSKINFRGNNQAHYPQRVVDESDQAAVEHDKYEFSIKSVDISIPLDVIFIFDSSASMQEEKLSMEQNLQKFLDKIIQESNAEENLNIVIIGKNFNFPIINTNVKIIQIDEHVFSDAALLMSMKLLSGELKDKDGNTVSLRQDAKKELIILSDDNGSSQSTLHFKQFINDNSDLKEKLTIHGIVGLSKQHMTDKCKIDQVGSEYIGLINNSNVSGGKLLDLCHSEFSEHLETIASSLNQQFITRDYDLVSLNKEFSIKSIRIEDFYLKEEDYSYDPKTKILALASHLELQKESKVEINFTDSTNPNK